MAPCSDKQVKFVLPAISDEALSAVLREITKYLDLRGHPKNMGILGGEYSYGVNYENSVFRMKAFCWCDREECPWCSGCTGTFEDPVHTEECYQALVRKDLLDKGFISEVGWASSYLKTPEGWTWDQRREAEESVRRKWCEHFNLPFPRGSAVHCSCGARERWEQEQDGCRCDFCAATGRHGQAGAEPGKGAPNFWHKPSGLKVWWYKWIGRGMEVHNPNGIDLPTFYTDCINSIAGEDD